MRVKKLYGHPVTRFVLVASICCVPLLAQSPFDGALSAGMSAALNFARVMSVIAIIWGLCQMAFGDGHRAGGIISILVGAVGMLKAQAFVNWIAQ